MAKDWVKEDEWPVWPGRESLLEILAVTREMVVRELGDQSQPMERYTATIREPQQHITAASLSEYARELAVEISPETVRSASAAVFSRPIVTVSIHCRTWMGAVTELSVQGEDEEVVKRLFSQIQEQIDARVPRDAAVPETPTRQALPRKIPAPAVPPVKAGPEAEAARVGPNRGTDRPWLKAFKRFWQGLDHNHRQLMIVLTAAAVLLSALVALSDLG